MHDKCKISDFKLSTVMQQHTSGVVGNIIRITDFVGNLLLFAAVKEFCKSIKN